MKTGRGMKVCTSRTLLPYEAADILYLMIPETVTLLWDSLQHLREISEFCAEAPDAIGRRVRVLDARIFNVTPQTLELIDDLGSMMNRVHTIRVGVNQIPHLFKLIIKHFAMSLETLEIRHCFHEVVEVDASNLRFFPFLRFLSITGASSPNCTTFLADSSVRRLNMLTQMSQADARMLSFWSHLEFLDLTGIKEVHCSNFQVPNGGWPRLHTVTTCSLSFITPVLGPQNLYLLIIRRFEGVGWGEHPRHTILPTFQNCVIEPSKEACRVRRDGNGTLRTQFIHIPRHPEGSPISEAVYLIPAYFSVEHVSTVFVEHLPNCEEKKTVAEFAKQHNLPIAFVKEEEMNVRIEKVKNYFC